MKVIDKDFNNKGISIILGFFDGIHCGHREVVNQAVNFAAQNNSMTLLITFKNSPAEFFKKEFKYIYPREISYRKIEALGVDYLLELDFANIINITAEEYLENLVKKYEPISITTGFNHTFGFNKQGNAKLLKDCSSQFGYEYFSIEPCVLGDELVSSTLIKNKLQKAELVDANKLLGEDFSLKVNIIEGEKLGRELGFPTANAKYPNKIIKLPYGVYKVSVLNKLAIMNWGVKPTFGKKKELLEIHIPGFNGNLYNKELEIKVLDKIRDEKKFASCDELVAQINEDLRCLKL